MAPSSRSMRALSCAVLLIPCARYPQSPAWANGRSAQTCEQCRLEGQEAVLCGPHQEEESVTLAEWVPRLDGADARVRGDALERIASLTLAHANAPSRKVAEVVTSLLVGDDPGMATCALMVLRTREQHADETATGLASALVSTASRWENYRGSLVKLTERPDDKDELMRLMTLPSWTKNLIAAAETYQDDRCVAAIQTLLGKDPERIPDKLAQQTAAAILRHPTQAGIECVVEYRNVLLKRLQRGPIPGPNETSEWNAVSTLLKQLDTDKDLGGQSVSTLLAIDEALARCAKEMNIKAPTPVSPKSDKPDGGSITSWSRWLKKNKALFRAELGKVGAVATEDPH